MRTNVTLDPDVVALVRRVMHERGVGFETAINDAIRAGLAASRVDAGTDLPVRSMGRPHPNLDRALQLAGEFEDDELIRQARPGS